LNNFEWHNCVWEDNKKHALTISRRPLCSPDAAAGEAAPAPPGLLALLAFAGLVDLVLRGGEEMASADRGSMNSLLIFEARGFHPIATKC
jgi:hypothetical protein